MKQGRYRVDSVEEFDEKDTDQPNGTLIGWTPDAEPFNNNIKISKEIVEDKCSNLSYILPNLTFEICTDKVEVIESKGLLGLFSDYLYEEHNFIKPFLSEKKNKSDSKYLEVKMAITFNSKDNIERSYVNLIPTSEHGSHVTAFKTVLTREFNKFFNVDFTGDEIRKHLSFIIAVNTSVEPTFVGQAKSQLKTPEINPELNVMYKEAVLEMFECNKKDFLTMIKILENIKKASDVEKILKQITGKKKAKTGLANVSSKYSGCQKDEGVELFLTEGLSAKGNKSCLVVQ